MLTSTFKKTTLSILSATIVAATMSASPSFAGEGGAGGRNFDWKIEPDVEGFREYVDREMGRSSSMGYQIRKPIWKPGAGDQEGFNRSQTQSTER